MNYVLLTFEIIILILLVIYGIYFLTTEIKFMINDFKYDHTCQKIFSSVMMLLFALLFLSSIILLAGIVYTTAIEISFFDLIWSV